ncbi:ribbon-helix-helix domain-containing protein [Sneathiella sp. CAU 1612]|jgi:predicted DNA-binding ribbon-helix-helix protein|uniref:Ribbon-helix-helix domain-containing protein n=1 Tax=Sneathiella sedimenti TaxID=2816034 RepID=A0ABS3FA96_9PROT|nr:ribbon-helix-helix domain-containing protein [Sneathiella sedimenti]MBO0335252.1 ribbon-helix-helix domain-containing protein [Sneathiella sedimenti]
MIKETSSPGTASTEIIKHSVSIAGHRTSVSLERKFWDLFQENAKRKGLSLNELITEIDATRQGNLSSAIRLFVLEELLEKARDQR